MAAYPTETDIKDFLEAGGLVTTTAQQAWFSEAAAAGKQIIERRCGRIFGGSGSNTTRYYSPPTCRSGRLYVADVASLVSVTYQPSGQATATTWTLNTDFWTEPENNAADGLPITALILRQRWSQPLATCYRRSVALNGEHGFATAAAGFPDAIRLAMVAAGCLEVKGQIAQALRGGLLSWKEADVSKTYGPDPLSGLCSEWGPMIETTVTLYRRARM